MNERNRSLHAIMAVLGHDSRYRLVLCLLGGERCVGELATAIGLSQSCTTRHVQALERAGVVRSRRDGKRVLVGIEEDRDGLPQLLDLLAPEAARPRRSVATGAAAAARSAGTRRTSPRSAGRSGAGRAHPAPPAGRSAPPAASEPAAEATPLGPPASGTHAPPEPEPTTNSRRPRDTIEDFLL